MQIGISPQPVIALIAGILILLVPRLLSVISLPSFSLYLAFSGWSADWHANLQSTSSLKMRKGEKLWESS